MFIPLKKFDWLLMLSVLLLVAIGLTTIYSSSLREGDFLNFFKQIIFLILGAALMVFLAHADWRALQNNPYLIITLYVLCCLGLLGLFFFAPAIRGVKSWYKMGPISIDPVEFTKLVLIILLAKYFSKRHIEVYRISHILISGLYMLVPVALVFFQPNLGSALILILIWLFVLVVSGIKIRHFLILLFCGLLVLVFSWFYLLKDYQKERVISFALPEISNPLGVGWSQQQAKIAIGSGKIWGKGFGQGSQMQYRFLPEVQTDFIFAGFAEEFGLAGAGLVLLLLAVLLWRIMRVAVMCSNNFGRLFSIGLATLLISQIFINIGMNIGLMPIIGIPLPLVSYGGSGLLTIFLGLGILQSISKEQ